MKNLFNSPFKGIVEDFKSRKACYNQDWSNALCSGPRYIRYVHDHFNNLNFLSFICFFFSPYKYWFWLFRYLNVYVRILAPTTCIFFASALPVIAFGEQLSKETGSYVLQRSIYLCVTSLLVTHTQSPEWSCLISLFRGKLEHRWHAGFYCYMWYHTLVVWWPAFVDLRSCRAHCNNV